MRKPFVLALCAIIANLAGIACAQVSYPPGMSLSDVQAIMPQPAATVPPVEAIGGTVGTPGTYRPADSAIPRITRAAVVTTDSNGAWSVTWSSALPSTPVVLPIAINSGSMPVTCNVITRSTTTATGKCWLAQSTLLSLSIVTTGLTLLPYGNAAASTQVQLIAIPPTQ